MAVAVALLAVAAPARGAPAHRNFWDRAIDPHGREVTVAIAKATENFRAAGDTLGRPGRGGLLDDGGDDSSIEALLDDARGMLRFALSLEPEEPRALLLLGQVCDELGRPDEAIAALEHYLAAEQPSRVVDEARFRLGRAYARRGDDRAAIAQLRHGAIRMVPGHMEALAELYQDEGRMDEAIDLLSAQSRMRTPTYLPFAAPATIALAAAYDRDEQVTRARELLDGLQPGGPGLLDLLRMPAWGNGFLRAGNRHYVDAMIYEAAGYTAEARIQWLHAARANPRFRARALAHVRAIDAGHPIYPAAAPPAPPPPTLFHGAIP